MATVKKATQAKQNNIKGYSITLSSEGKKPFQLRGVFINVLPENSLNDYDLTVDNLIHLLQTREVVLTETNQTKEKPDVLDI